MPIFGHGLRALYLVHRIEGEENFATNETQEPHQSDSPIPFLFPYVWLVLKGIEGVVLGIRVAYQNLSPSSSSTLPLLILSSWRIVYKQGICPWMVFWLLSYCAHAFSRQHPVLCLLKDCRLYVLHQSRLTVTAYYSWYMTRWSLCDTLEPNPKFRAVLDIYKG